METPLDDGNNPIIQRVLKLRRRMGIANELSTIDPRDNILWPSQMNVSGGCPANAKTNIPDVYGWLAWETSPPDEE